MGKIVGHKFNSHQYLNKMEVFSLDEIIFLNIVHAIVKALYSLFFLLLRTTWNRIDQNLYLCRTQSETVL